MVCLVGLCVGLSGGAQGGYQASIGNSGNTIRTGTLLLNGSPTSSGCDTAALPAFTALPSATCTGASLLPPTTPASSNVTLTADGTLPTAAQVPTANASLSTGVCGPVRLLNTITATDPMLVRGGVGYAQAGPLTGSAALGLDGVTASHSMSSDVSQQNSATVLGANFSAAIWFKVSTGNSGPLLGFGSSPNDTAEGASDTPVIWIDTAGKVHAGGRSTLGTVTANSSGTTSYSDGAWHLAVMTVSSGVLTMTVSIYVDSSAAGSSTVLLSLATGFAGYWHAGWSPISASPWNSGTPNYLKATLADAAVFNTTLSAATVASLATSSSQANWLSRVTAAGAISSWPLGDDGTTSYTGSLPVIGTTSACTFVDVAIGGTGYCIYPNAIGTACAAPASKLSSLASSGPFAFTAIASTASKLVTSTTQADAAYATSCSTYCPGLHLLLPMTVTESYAGFASTLSFNGSQTVI